jgi:hypothetical protein
MTLGVIEREGSLLATMIALDCESVGDRCLIFKDFAHVTRLIHTVPVEKIVVDVDRPGLSALDWLEILAPSWPDLPLRTLLLAESELTPRDVSRVHKLGAELVYTPPSLADATHVVMERLRQARPNGPEASGRDET